MRTESEEGVELMNVCLKKHSLSSLVRSPCYKVKDSFILGMYMSGTALA